MKKKTRYKSADGKRYPPLRILLLAEIVTLLGQYAYGATQLSQYGITWTFDRDYTVGQFATGDYWVVGPVTIAGINPPSENVGGRIKNGSMLNPDPTRGDDQGYDSDLDGELGSNSNPYIESLNVARKNGMPLSPSNTLTVQPGSSIISTISVENPASPNPWIQTAAVLTVLDAPASSGSFRPPYVGTDKTIRFNKSQLNYSLLAKLAPVATTPSSSEFNTWFERPWIDYVGSADGRLQHPRDNMVDNGYGRDMATRIGEASLILQLNFTDPQKETLLIGLVQYGIDLYGVVESGATTMWWQDGGHGGGRKWPILFAGLMLDDPNMKAIGSRAYNDPYFGEDHTTFYVEETSPGVYNNGLGGYSAGDVGLAEYGKWHNTIYASSWENKEWDAPGYYRCCCHATAFGGIVLSAHIMEGTASAKTLWNHKALFDYQDRYMDVEAQLSGDGHGVGGWKRQYSRFAEEMWDTYRAGYGCVWTRDNPSDIYSNGYNPCDLDSVPPLAPANLATTGQTESSITLSWTAPAAASDGDLASGYKIYRNGTHVGTALTNSFQDTGLAAQTTYNYDVNSLDDVGNESVSGATGTFSTAADDNPPSVVSVSANQTSVEIVFNEAMDQSSAENSDNYSINKGISVNAASLGADLVTVTLTTSSHADDAYTLTITNVKDAGGNTMSQTAVQYVYGLVGYWKFDDGAGTQAVDSSGRGNHGTLVNGPYWTTGKVGGALGFDGANDYVEIGAQDVSFPWTASFWVKREDSSNTNAALLDSINYSLKLEQYPSTNKVGFTAYGVADYTFNYEAPTGTWVHLVFVGSQAETRLYVNGTSADAVSTGISCPVARISSTTASRPLKGVIDEVRVYSRGLNAAEVLNLYNQASPPDTNGPVISSVQSSNITSVGATITWVTDENSNSQVEYGLDPNYGNTTELDANLVTSHSVALTDLVSETLYYYRVKSKDAAENESISEPNTFTTAGVVIHTLSVSSTAGGSVTTPGEAGPYPYSYGESASIIAQADPNYHFVSWTGTAVTAGKVAGPGSASTTVTMHGDYTVQANFTINQHTLTVSSTAGGSVTTPGEAGPYPYSYGQSASIIAQADPNYHFVSWTGTAVTAGKVASPGSASTTVTMHGDYTVQANFAINQHTLTVSSTTGGSVTTPGEAGPYPYD
ncbi:MAG TPA: LamG-like jellyroll fold domain-containing protein, partial [Sedimentisphaerales bacterium]|nr:LamG-like jellyroll fold domain-containing protein [Sedimentisphaerales bacterium]